MLKFNFQIGAQCGKNLLQSTFLKISCIGDCNIVNPGNRDQSSVQRLTINYVCSYHFCSPASSKQSTCPSNSTRCMPFILQISHCHKPLNATKTNITKFIPLSRIQLERKCISKADPVFVIAASIFCPCHTG